MKIALIYDWVNKFGGAEQILLALHELWPAAPLFTSVYHPKKALWAKTFRVIPSFLNHLPYLHDKHEYLAFLMPYAFESLDLSTYDIIISVSSAGAKGVMVKPNQLHLNYCLTPTRYLWHQTHLYLNTPIKRLLLLPFISSLRRWDYVAAHRPDYLIPISKTVSHRIGKFYRCEPLPVIYPPVKLERFKTHPKNCASPKPGYFLIVSRLVPYKKIDLALNAFKALPEFNLVVIGTGVESRKLKQLAPPNVAFIENATDNLVNCYFHHARALIIPQEEDFGLTAVEAQACNLPVITYARGGGAETVIHQQTGLHFYPQTATALILAIKTFLGCNWYDKPIRQNAMRFSQTKFKEQFKQKVEDLWHQHQQLK